MFTNIDCELYPEDCEVAFMPLHNQWVYLIQKNGTSSIRDDHQSNRVILRNRDLTDLEFVDIYLRNPQERYVSGVNTFVQHLQKDNPALDKDTLIWMSTRYLFLNRHYLPQLHWLINLSRFIGKDTKLRLRDFKDFSNIVSIHHRPDIQPVSPNDEKKILENDRSRELWFYLDQILIDDLVGQSVSWDEIKQHYQSHHSEIWTIVTQTANTFNHVLS